MKLFNVTIDENTKAYSIGGYNGYFCEIDAGDGWIVYDSVAGVRLVSDPNAHIYREISEDEWDENQTLNEFSGDLVALLNDANVEWVDEPLFSDMAAQEVEKYVGYWTE